MTKHAAMVTLILLGGCVNSAAQQVPQEYAYKSQAEYYRSRSEIKSEITACRDRTNDSRFDRIKSRIATDIPPTITQLADAQKPNAADRGLLIEWGTLLTECRTKGYATSPGYPWEQFQIAIALLAAGEVTYGAHNRKIVELLAIMKAHGDVEEQIAAQRRAIEQTQNDAAAGAMLGAGLDMFIAGQQIRALRGR